MSNEGIEYAPSGTVEVTFDDKTYKLPPGKTKHWLYYKAEMKRLTDEAHETVRNLARAVGEASDAIVAKADPVLRGVLEEAEASLLEAQRSDEPLTRLDVGVRERAWTDVYNDASDELRQAYDDAKQQLSDYAKDPFYRKSSALLRDMYDELSDDKLPRDVDDWPVWLATDNAIVGTILKHWEDNPKASGSNGARTTDRPSGSQSTTTPQSES